jgi:hypothetical protein
VDVSLSRSLNAASKSLGSTGCRLAKHPGEKFRAHMAPRQRPTAHDIVPGEDPFHGHHGFDAAHCAAAVRPHRDWQWNHTLSESGCYPRVGTRRGVATQAHREASATGRMTRAARLSALAELTLPVMGTAHRHGDRIAPLNLCRLIITISLCIVSATRSQAKHFCHISMMAPRVRRCAFSAVCTPSGRDGDKPPQWR